MKKNRIFGMLAAAALLLGGGCSDDVADPEKNGGTNISPEDGVYMTVNFDLPTAGGTRSFTDKDNYSNSGVEIGSDAENMVSDVVIVLAKLDNSYVASAEVLPNNIMSVTSSGKTIYKSTSVFSKTDIAAYYNTDTFDEKIHVFVFCNPTLSLKKKLESAQLGDNDWYNFSGKYNATDTSPEVIWAGNSFLMSNSAIATRELPGILLDWDNYSKETTPFNLSGMNSEGLPNEVNNLAGGNVKVERAAARFDFRDGSEDGIIDENGTRNPDKSFNGIGNQTYEVLRDADGNAFVNVKLGKMSLVNLNKDYYFLKRVSPTGLNSDVTLCGEEKPWYKTATGVYLENDGNYVVDVNVTWKTKKPLLNSGFNTYFNYPFFNENGKVDNTDTGKDRWSTSVISEVLKGADDNINNWNPNGTTYKRYKVWRYATENTIPGVETQKNAISTGVVFKGVLLPAREAKDNDDQATKDLLNALKLNPDKTAGNTVEDKMVYFFAGQLYCGWDNVRQSALSYAITDLKKVGDDWTYTINKSGALYNAVYGSGGFGSFQYKHTAEDGTVETIPLTDAAAQDETSANYKYTQWKDPNADDPNSAYQAFKAAVVGANMTIYQRSYDEDLGGWGYYCYYYYWNRHNDNGQPGIMGPMEFAVVRNNVYKLAVTKIARLGHPRIAENDPDAPNPNTPDEQSNIYITVNCETLPWVVRLNDIEF